jgi:hypothetical protein
MLHFDKDNYELILGDPARQTAQVHVLLDADDSTPGDQVLPHGLFAMAFQVNFDPTKVQVALDRTGLPPALDDDGTGRPPTIEVGNDFLRVRAALKADIFDPEFFKGEDMDGRQVMRLATLTLTGLDLGDLNLSLGLFKRSATDQVFIDGSGQVLDDDFGFRSASVQVNPIPEPLSAAALAVGGLACLFRRTTRSH